MTPAQQKRIDNKIADFISRCFSINDWKFGDDIIHARFNDFDGGMGEFEFLCDKKPYINLSDMNRLALLLKCGNLTFSVDSKLVQNDGDDSYRTEYTIVVGVAYQ